MKWSLQQLNKSKSFDFQTTFNFEDEIAAVNDIIEISLITVTGKFQFLHEKFIFDLNIKGSLILEDAITLEKGEFLLNIDVIETYSYDENSLDSRIIKTNTIDLKEAIWENIILEKPIRFIIESNE